MVFASIRSISRDNVWDEHPDTLNYPFKSYCTGTMNRPQINFIPRPLHHCPSRGCIYRDNYSSVYQTCTATVPACNKNSAMTAKTTPWLLASRDHNCLKNHTLPGWSAQPTLTTFHHRAVSLNERRIF